MRAVVIGGFATGKSTLENVAEALCDRRLADDADVLTFPQAMADPDKVERITRRRLILTHSAGILAVHRNTCPSEIIACNGPEPQRFHSLLNASWRKMQHNRQFAKEGPCAAAYALLVRSNMVEGLRHPVAHVSRISAIGRFSTTQHLLSHLEAQSEGNFAASQLFTQDDEYFPHDPTLGYGQIRMYEHEGNHDALLASPRTVLSVLGNGAPMLKEQ